MRAGHEKPVDAAAARVVARGESFEYRALNSEICSPTPLALRPVAIGEFDLKGKRFGRLTVIGKYREVKGRWVCRCSCGNYVVRRTHVVLAAAMDSACPQCYLMAVSKRHEFMRRTGLEKPTGEFL